MNERPPSLAEVASVPAALERVLERLLAKDPADRLASASEVEAALREAMEDDDTRPLRPLDGPSARPAGSDTLPLPRPQPTDEAGPPAHADGERRRPMVLGGIVLVLVLLVGAVAFAASERRDGSSLERVDVPGVAGAYDDLVRSIARARADRAVTQAAAAGLEQRASAIRRAFRAGDAEAVESGIDGFAQTLARTTGSGDVSFDAAAAIADAFDRYIAALDATPPPSPSPVVSSPTARSARVRKRSPEARATTGRHHAPTPAGMGRATADTRGV